MPQSDKPRSIPWRRVWVGLAVGALVLGGIWWQMRANAPTAVQVEQVALGPVTRVLAVNGNVAAQTAVQVRAAVTATALDVTGQDGAAVVKGDTLAQLDDSKQQAMLDQASSALEQGRIVQTQAAAVFGRDRDLAGLVARSVLDDSRSRLDSAAQEVARLTALRDQAVIEVSRYKIKAPIAGTLMSRAVDPGQLVDPTVALFTIADLSVLVVKTTVDEAYATQIALGQTADVQLVGRGDILAGKVIFVSPRVDAATGGLAVTIGFDGPVTTPIGLTATVNIVVDQQTALTVPRTALQGESVFILVNGKAKLTPVTVIDWPASRLIVTQGLKSGDVLISDSTAIADGISVTKAAP